MSLGPEATKIGLNVAESLTVKEPLTKQIEDAPRTHGESTTATFKPYHVTMKVS